MRFIWFSFPAVQRIIIILALLWLGSGCSSTSETVAASIGLTALAAHSPTHEIEQIYYLGVFDPQEQVPPTVYRVRVHGQASSISFMRFSSGWVPAGLIDSLGTSISFQKAGATLKIEEDEKLVSMLPTGRKLVLFGPEGFRQAPKDHRLVIVMGSEPEKFFKAIDISLGMVSEMKAKQFSAELQQDVLMALLEISKERQRLDELAKGIDADFCERKEPE
jgi:hypothetical protein